MNTGITKKIDKQILAQEKEKQYQEFIKLKEEALKYLYLLEDKTCYKNKKLGKTIDRLQNLYF